ncbi:PAS domain S-box protein [Erythrobacter sp. SCSIO 43205]|uniref:sensor histidine kinase n=1 Tax=Erythrobacter sp. SCSIO 43205 TaxID=2779361 RepID=UPI001CA9C468|nr:ATP-binding protein [Erythrobacter sp. SCSIO 43205]UAB77837.1 PAS domain S-box protein [Erythrobacter sp. SCSIO 43205]
MSRESSLPPVPPPPPPSLSQRGEGGAGLPTESGEETWIEVIQQMDAVYADLITSQTALEKQHLELVEAHDLIDSVLESMTDVLLACSADGRIQRVNRALLKVIGQSADKMVSREISELFDKSEQPSIREAMAHVRAGGAVDQREWHLVAADGALATVSTNIAARHDGAGKFAGFVFVGRPLGELQRAYRDLDEAHRKLTQTQEQLLMSEKMAALGRLVAGVAHELNNPISFVFGNMYSLKKYGEAISRYLEAAEGELQGSEMIELRRELRIDNILSDIGPLVEGTLEGAERVRDIVQDLRRFSSSQKEEPETFNLIRLISTAIDWVAKAQRIKPEFRIDAPEALEVTVMKGQAHQILVNLIQNACDAVQLRDDPLIAIAVRENADEVQVIVSDNGPGIAVENRDKIFEPFFTTKPIGSGTGLGLYVSYSMASRLGGELSLAPSELSGASFMLTLPKSGDQGEDD